VPLGWIAGATLAVGIGSDVVQGINASNANSIASTQEGMASTIFGEQQSFESQLAKLVQNPSSITSTPGYAFNEQQGQQALARQFAAGGFSGSGNEGIGITEFGQNYAMNTYSQQAQLLAQLAGITNASSPSQAGEAATSANKNSANQWNNLFAQLGITGGLLNNTNFNSPGTPAASAGASAVGGNSFFGNMMN
jgi:hypothetical protein